MAVGLGRSEVDNVSTLAEKSLSQLIDAVSSFGDVGRDEAFVTFIVTCIFLKVGERWPVIARGGKVKMVNMRTPS